MTAQNAPERHPADDAYPNHWAYCRTTTKARVDEQRRAEAEGRRVAGDIWGQLTVGTGQRISEMQRGDEYPSAWCPAPGQQAAPGTPHWDVVDPLLVDPITGGPSLDWFPSTKGIEA